MTVTRRHKVIVLILIVFYF